NPDYLRRPIYYQADCPAVETSDNYSIIALLACPFGTKPFPEIKHRHEITAEVHHTLNICLRLRDRSNLAHGHHLFCEHDVEREILRSDFEDHQLSFCCQPATSATLSIVWLNRLADTANDRIYPHGLRPGGAHRRRTGE